MINGEGNLAAIWIAVGQDEGGQGELGGHSVNKLSGGQVGNPSPSYHDERTKASNENTLL